MIKNKLFCKLMSIVCSIFITSLFGVNNNFVGAVGSRAVLDSVLEKHPDLKQSLGFKSHKEFCDAIQPVYQVDIRAKFGNRLKDNARFVYFIKFIVDSVLSEDLKISLICESVSMRCEKEREYDGVVAKKIMEPICEALTDAFKLSQIKQSLFKEVKQEEELRVRQTAEYGRLMEFLELERLSKLADIES